MDDHTNGLPADPTQSPWAWIIGVIVMSALGITGALYAYQQDPVGAKQRIQFLLNALGL